MTKTQRTNYINRVRRGIEVYEAMAALENEKELKISYNDKRYNIRAYDYTRKSDNSVDRSYTINDTQLFGRSMNIDMTKSGKSYLFAYTFDMFNNKTTYKIDFSKVDIVKEVEKEVEKVTE